MKKFIIACRCPPANWSSFIVERNAEPSRMIQVQDPIIISSSMSHDISTSQIKLQRLCTSNDRVSYDTRTYCQELAYKNIHGKVHQHN